MKKKITLFSIFIYGSIYPIVALADGKYQLLQPIGNLGTDKPTDFSEYLTNFFDWFVAICALAAILMLVVAGLEYASAGLSETAKGNAKKRAEGAILGLLLALGGYLILKEINPNLLKFNLTVNKPGTTK